MDLYRIGPEQYLSNFSGMGGSFKDGARWNICGQPVIYFALSPSVAMLEMANYLPSPRLVPKTYRLGHYFFKVNTAQKGRMYDELILSDMPSDWNNYPYPRSTQDIGSKWLSLNKKPILLVPSAAVPGGLEKIAVFNPMHADARGLGLLSAQNKVYNDRMFSSMR